MSAGELVSLAAVYKIKKIRVKKIRWWLEREGCNKSFYIEYQGCNKSFYIISSKNTSHMIID